jgi:hypothetical protein
MKSLRRWMVALAALTAFGLTACGDNGTVAGNGNVTGFVWDGSHPVPDALVTVGTQNTRTGLDGRFTLTNIPVGQYQVTVTKPGYRFEPVTVNVTSNGLAQQDVQGQRSSSPPTLTATVTPTQLQFTGGQVTVSATASDVDGDLETVTAAYDDGQGGTGAVVLTAATPGRYTGTATLPPNTTTTARSYTFTVTATDGLNDVSKQQAVTVKPILAPIDVGGSTGGGGQPPIPSMR